MRCMECGAEMRLTNEAFCEAFQKEEFEVTGVEHYACDRCGEVELDAKAMAESRRQADSQYRERHGLLSPEAIRNIRRSLKLNQKEFEAMLGLSSPTVSRWETGAIVQPEAMDKFLRIVDAHSCVAQDLMEHAEVGASKPATIARCSSWKVKAPGTMMEAMR